ncbi:MAG: hypothetical protein M3N54_07660 [Acidobacteriota bacterium]|nr:hypothetical protein [Acidobacteriota bacterium]
MDIRCLWEASSKGTRVIWIAAILSVFSVSTGIAMAALLRFSQTAGK